MKNIFGIKLWIDFTCRIFYQKKQAVFMLPNCFWLKEVTNWFY